MSLTAINAPDVDLNGYPSKWVAAYHPVIYRLQRVDANVQLKQYFTGGTVRLNFSAPIPTGVEVGQRLKYFSPNGQSYIWTIGAITGSGNTIITSDGMIPGTEAGGTLVWLDLYNSYFVEVEVLSIDTSNTYVSIGELLVRSGLEGEIEANVSKWLQTLAVFPNNFDYDQINEAVEGEGGRYSLRFTEIKDGVRETTQQPFSIRYWSNSAKQIQSAYGSNMADYNPTPDATREDKAKFLTMFDSPTYFPGFPFSLNFIYSDQLANLVVTREEDELDINGNITTHNSDELLISERFFNNRLMLKESYSTDVKSLDVWLNSDAASTDPELEEGDYGDGTIFEPWSPNEPTIRPVKLTR